MGKLCNRAAPRTQGHAPCLRRALFMRFPSHAGRNSVSWLEADIRRPGFTTSSTSAYRYSASCDSPSWFADARNQRRRFGGQEGSDREVLLALLLTCSTHSGGLTAGPNIMVLTPLFHVINLESSTAGPAPEEQDSREELQLRWNKD